MTTHKSITIFASCCLVATLGLFCFADVIQAVTIAALRPDYDAHTPANGVNSVAANITDTQGNGTWNFYGSVTEDPTSGGAGLVNLVYSTSSNSVRNANAYTDPGQNLDLSGVSNTQLIAGGGEGVPAANELALHPGNENATRPFFATRWTAGSGEAGNVSVTGTIQDIGAAGTLITFAAFDDTGTALVTSQIVGGTQVPFNFNDTVAVGDDIWFVVGPNGNWGNDHSALSITIDQAANNVIPEPSTFGLAALGLLSLGMIGWRRRRR